MSQIPPPPVPPNQPPPPGQFPPQPPQPLSYGTSARSDLKEIASQQRAIMLCILAYIVAVICQFALPQNLRLFVGLAVMAVGVIAAVFIFMLAIKLYGTGVGILLGILTLIPCIGLIVLLIVNGKATNILRENGVKVGLLGADPKQVPDASPDLPPRQRL
jgi:hypothetical protein